MQSFLAADGIKIAYDDQGQGPAVLCIPGLTRNMDDFAPVLAQFAGQARIIRIDLRGRGASGYDPNFANYSVPQEAADVVALLDHLGLEQAAILGTSRGGLIAMFLGATQGHRLSSVLLNDVGPVLDQSGLDGILTYLGRPAPFATLAQAAEKLPAFYAPDFANVPDTTWRTFAGNLWSEGPNGLELRYDPNLRNAVEALFVADATVPDLWPLFDALTAKPLALIRGANSNLLTAQTAQMMQDRAPDMLFAQVPDRGHVPFLDEPESVEILTRWLEQLS
jgi:pimeloyl-ACP methyl ester carboxylesterase